MASWILRWIAASGYPALFVLAAAECIFPPLPSEVIFPLAGYLAKRGSLTLAGCILAGVAGATLGALPLFLLGRRMGPDRLARFVRRHGRWAAISPESVQRANSWFARHGGKTVLIAHVVPGLRSLVALPAGVARMPVVLFLLFTAIGSTIWIAALCAAGYALGSAYGEVERWLDPVTWIVFAAVGIAYVYRVIRPKR